MRPFIFRIPFAVLLAVAGLTMPGCGPSKPAPTPRAAAPQTRAASAPPTRQENPKATSARAPTSPLDEVDFMGLRNAPQATSTTLPEQSTQAPPTREFAAPRQIDERRLAEAGLRKLLAKHVTLYTDLPSSPSVDELPQVFDIALPQWSAYFGIALKDCENWRVVGYLMQRKETFSALGLLPDFLPAFENGFNYGGEFWLFEQPTDYYRRHLMLHEGTHAFMEQFLGGAGPPWYREGMAELLATHRWEDGALTMNWMPPNSESVPHWGRVKVIREAYENSTAMGLDQVLALPVTAHRSVEAYAWSWAACAFLDGIPQYRDRFRSAMKNAADKGSGFNARLMDQFQSERKQLHEQWQLFVGNVDYGYDFTRNFVQHRSGQPLPAEGQSVTITADRGWQSTGVLLEAGKTYKITSSGRYQIGSQPKPWHCEPNGVTIRYHHGGPLGALVGALRDDDASYSITPLLHPSALGAERAIRPKSSGTLYVQINETPDGWSDNSGELLVTVREQPAAAVPGK